jgi:hypothetical protein
VADLRDGPDQVDGPSVEAALKTPAPRRGRPRCSEEPLGSVTVHLPTTAHDRIIRLASQRRQTVSEYLRDVLIQVFLNRS